MAGQEVKKSMRQMVAEMMYERNGPFTAKRLQDAIGMHTKVKLSSLSSTLKKMVDDGLLLRVEKFGPRGGYGYMENKNRPGALRKLAGVPPRSAAFVANNPIADLYMNQAGYKVDE